MELGSASPPDKHPEEHAQSRQAVRTRAGGAAAAGSKRCSLPPPGSAAGSGSDLEQAPPTGPAGPPPPPHSWQRIPPHRHRNEPDGKEGENDISSVIQRKVKGHQVTETSNKSASKRLNWFTPYILTSWGSVETAESSVWLNLWVKLSFRLFSCLKDVWSLTEALMGNVRRPSLRPDAG